MSKGIVNVSHDLLLEFCDPLHVSEMIEARNFKFGTQTEHKAFQQKVQN